MASEATGKSRLEIGHVLMMDVVGYSKLLIEDQREILRDLNAIVRETEAFREAESAEKLVRLPTGDGMVLVFYTAPEAPVECAMEIARALRARTDIPLRMGIHSGPLSSITDVNDRANVAGAGINMAQRVMDFGDAGHILLSQRVAEDLGHFREWQPCLHSLGECEAKHGVRVGVCNFYNDEVGNPKRPQKCAPTKLISKLMAEPKQRARVRRLRAAVILIVIIGVIVWQIRAQRAMKAEVAMLRQGIMEFPQIEAQVRGSQQRKDANLVEEQAYAALGKQFKVDPSVLRQKMPRLADELRQESNANTYERANASYVAKDYAQGERLALQAAEELRKNQPGNARQILAALELAGLSAHKAIQYDRAMEHFREAEKLTDRARHLEQWVTLQHEIADLLVAQGKYGEAEKLHRSVIEARTKALGPEDPDTLDSRHRLIYALTRQTKYAEAETEARQVLKLREKALGPENVDTVVSRYNLADTLVDQGKYPEAEALYRDVIRLSEKIHGPEDPGTLAARLGLATVLGSEGKDAEAETLYREIIALDLKVYGPEHPNTLNDRQNLATTLQGEGKYPEAEAQYKDVITIDNKVIGPEHPDTLTCRNNFTEMLDDEKKYAEAETECREIIGLENKALGPENRVTLNSRGNLAAALIGQGKFPEAETEYKDVLKSMERVLGLEHPDTLGYTTKFAKMLAQQNRTEEARALVGQMEEKARQAAGPNSVLAGKFAQLANELDLNK